MFRKMIGTARIHLRFDRVFRKGIVFANAVRAVSGDQQFGGFVTACHLDFTKEIADILVVLPEGADLGSLSSIVTTVDGVSSVEIAVEPWERR